jgi:hypothetical protein
MAIYSPPAMTVLGTVEELTAGKEISGADQVQGSFPQSDDA